MYFTLEDEMMLNDADDANEKVFDDDDAVGFLPLSSLPMLPGFLPLHFPKFEKRKLLTAMRMRKGLQEPRFVLRLESGKGEIQPIKRNSGLFEILRPRYGK